MAETMLPEHAGSPETAAFWAAANEGRLTLKWCTACGKTHWYPRAICPHCGSDQTEWRDASGRGTIYTFSIARRPAPAYAIAYVTLEEGPTMMTNIVDCDFADIAIGQKVEVTFRPGAGGQAVPMFRPAG